MWREDALRWNKLWFYPGAVTILIPRFIGACTLCVFMISINSVLIAGAPHDKPFVGVRKTVMRWNYKFFTTVFQYFCNFTHTTFKEVTLEQVNHYEKWLGPKDCLLYTSPSPRD